MIKLTQAQIQQAKLEMAKGIPAAQLAKKYNVTAYTLLRYKNRVN